MTAAFMTDHVSVGRFANTPAVRIPMGHATPRGAAGHDEATFQRLLEKVARNKGLDFSLYRRGTLTRRIEARLRATGCPDYLAYIAHLNHHPKEYDELRDAVTINVTEFFRDPEAFEALRTQVLPELFRFKEAQGRRIIRAWSAGTSSGEEAYSLSILFSEALAERRSEFHVRIYGTDVDPHCIARAQEGTYASSSLKNVPKGWLTRYFHPEGEGYAVKEAVKALIRFQLHNLVSGPYLQHVDLILCRNVVIYFTRPLQALVYSRFAGALNEGGFLVLGKVESIWGDPEACVRSVDARERIYQKPFREVAP